MKNAILALLVSVCNLTVRAEELTWLTNMPQAMAKARAEHKMVLADFTGSDWCYWCKKLDSEIFATPEFSAYAKTNLILVQLDYPHEKEQSAEVKAANKALLNRFKVDGFPTLIYMRGDATVVWRNDGYLGGGPQALIQILEEKKPKS